MARGKNVRRSDGTVSDSCLMDNDADSEQIFFLLWVLVAG